MIDTLGPVNRLAEFAGIAPATLYPYLLSCGGVPALCAAFQSLGDGGAVYAEPSQGFLYDYFKSWLSRDPEILRLINDYRTAHSLDILEV